MMDSDPIDLSPLGLPDLRRARMARAVMARAQTGGTRTPLGVLAVGASHAGRRGRDRRRCRWARSPGPARPPPTARRR